MNPQLDAALGQDVKVRINHPNGTSLDVGGPLLGYDLATPMPYVVLQTPSTLHAKLLILGPGAEVVLPYTAPTEHPGLTSGPDRVTHPGLR